MTRFQVTFYILIVVQGLHSVEEYVGKLWQSFPPAEFLTGLVSEDHRLGFLVINISLVTFGAWCAMWPVRKGWKTASPLAIFWITIELINGVGHPLWTLQQTQYTPGILTAPVLLVVSLILTWQMLNNEPLFHEGNISGGSDTPRRQRK